MESNKFATLLHKKSNKISRVLKNAILEWTLISLLLLNSLFSLLILKFARYFGLKPPCILCSRLDHHFLKTPKNRGSPVSYAELICEEHAAEISRIGYCSHHRKLVESHSLCDDCSPEKSPDAPLLRWMREIGIVSSNDEDGVIGDGDDNCDIKRCSCCDLVIRVKEFSSPFVNVLVKAKSLDQETGDFVINDNNLQMGSGSDSDAKYGYQVLDDDDDNDDDHEEDKEREGDVVLEAEKQPLLKDSDDVDDDINNEDVFVTDQNLCPDMLPQHLDFYIDHDDYRLIPVGSLMAENEEICDDFELVFEGDDIVTSGCKVVSKSLPCIQEEEEQEETSLVEDLQRVHDQEVAKSVVADDDSQMLLSNEESKIEERNTPTMQVQQDEDEEREDESQIAQNHQEENMIEERSLTALQVQEVEEKKMEEDSLISQLNQEESEVENVASIRVNESPEAESVAIVKKQEEQDEAIESAELTSTPSEKQVEDTASHLRSDEIVAERNEYARANISSEVEEPLKPFQLEGLTITNYTLTITDHVVSEVSTSSSHLASVDNHDGQQTEGEEEGEAGNSIDIGAEIAEENQVVNVALTHNEMEEEINEDPLSHLRSDETVTERNEHATNETFSKVEESPTPCKHEGLTIMDHAVNEVSTSSAHLASVDNYDHKQTENEGEAEAGTSRGIGAGITEGNLLHVNVALTHNEVEEERIPDTATSSESLDHLHKNILLLERRESAAEESLDGNMVSELEVGDGAAAIEKFKSKLNAEREALRALYKELEEERNAAAIAANHTMAMINRLQEEKATMQMEALQYQRMMEEQSEYDQEALQMMNELMVKREKEKQELEKELEVYRKKVIDYEERERIRMLCRMRDDSMRSRNSSASCSYGGEESDGLSVDLNHETKDQEEDGVTSQHSHDENGHQDTPTEAVLGLQDSLASFEEERHAILEQLKALEEKLFILAEEEEEHIENMKPLKQFYEENGKDFENGCHDVSAEANGGENGYSHVNGKHQLESRINGSMQKRLLPLFDATEMLESPDLNGKEDGFDSHEFHKSPMTKFELEKKRLAIEEEVDHVYERLLALEADREFLKHCIGSLRKGDKGLDLLQEILQHLRDLKNVELQAMKNMDHCASV